VVRHAFRR